MQHNAKVMIPSVQINVGMQSQALNKIGNKSHNLKMQLLVQKRKVKQADSIKEEKNSSERLQVKENKSITTKRPSPRKDNSPGRESSNITPRIKKYSLQPLSKNTKAASYVKNSISSVNPNDPKH
jgi:hypothetical protein